MPKRILVVDDDESLRDLLKMMLRHAGYEVVTASNGIAGIKEFRAAAFDLVITDVIMPEKEGLETISDLRREFPNVKIIAMSGGGKFLKLDLLQVAQRLGAQRTLNKPFNQMELLETIKEVLG
jgi:DNA-binding response OmpR family regulator